MIYIECFDNFVKQLKIIFSDEEQQNILTKIENMTVEEKSNNCKLFNSLFNDENFDMLVKSKIKVFSHKNEDTLKISESLFGSELPIKNLLNNQTDEVKNVIWINLQTLYLYIEYSKNENEQNRERMQFLNCILYAGNERSDKTFNKIKQMLGTDVNDQTSELLDDIVKSFESMMGNLNGTNPNKLIMEISEKITNKYADKINNGEIEVDKIMETISSKIPGIEEMMNTMKNVMGKSTKPKETVVMDENFSTADVEVADVKDENGTNIKIGNMLKMANKVGLIPTGKSDNSEETSTEMQGLPDFSKVFNLIQRLDNTESKEDADNLKTEMSNFLQTELGLDVEKLNQQFEELSKQIKETNHEENQIEDDIEIVDYVTKD